MNEETQAAMQAWRLFRQTRLETEPDANESVADQLTSVRSALAGIERWLPPPSKGLTGETAVIVSNWTPSWTRDLTNSRNWQRAKEKLKAIYELIANGSLDDADWELRQIFLRCVPGVRGLETAPPVIRAQTEDLKTIEQPEEAEQQFDRDAIQSVVDWMSRL